MTGPLMPGRARWLAMVVLVATFLVGALAGAATLRAVSAREPAAGAGDARDDGHREHGSLLDRLDLSPAQRARADSILQRRRAETDAFWKEHGPALRAIVDSTRTEIRAILTPEQRAREDSIRAERKAYYERRERERQAASPGSEHR